MKASVPSTGSARLPKGSGHRSRWDGGRGSSKRRRRQAGDCHGGGLPLHEVSEAAPSVASDENGHVRNGPFVLEWRIPQRSLVPRAWEEALLSLLVKYGRKERGMMRDHPLHRTKQIEKKLHKIAQSFEGESVVAPAFRLDQALSLRRLYMKYLNPRVPMAALRLGRDEDIFGAAQVCERAFEHFLRDQKIPHWTEEEQRRQRQLHEEDGNGQLDQQPHTKWTPDFWFPHPVELRFVSNRRRSANDTPTGTTIRWLEIKMFYGASSIPAASKGNAIGGLVEKMRAYANDLGPGAICFWYGCGAELAEELAGVGVIALAASPTLPDRLRRTVAEHQKGWCSHRETGRILP